MNATDLLGIAPNPQVEAFWEAVEGLRGDQPPAGVHPVLAGVEFVWRDGEMVSEVGECVTVTTCMFPCSDGDSCIDMENAEIVLRNKKAITEPAGD